MSEIGIVPNRVYGYEQGGSPRESAMLYQQKNEKEQAELSQQLGGRRRKHFSRSKRVKHMLRNRRRFFKYGGEGKVVVPSFAPSGPPVGPVDNNTLSADGNQALLQAKVDAKGDEVPQSGGRKTKSRRVRSAKNGGKKQPFAISAKRVKRSPFSSVSSVKKTLRAHKKGRKIGYTQKSSLRSMGLIKRSNGVYRLGDKYKH
jgi:hypothetical protein